MTRLRLALWGTGSMAAKHVESAVAAFAPVAAEVCEGACELVAIAARNAPAAEDIKSKHGQESTQIFSTAEEMIAETEIDALICAVPPGIQSGQAALAASKGIHLFLEKPVALNIEEVKKIAAAAQATKVKTQICHHFRCDPSIIRLRELMESGEAGKLCQYQARFWMNGDMSAWWKDPALGGGQVIEQLIH
ncbi:MAG: Gfo/Idh/MocA family oxidoreductase, partial [Planctomycetes bacterium]|nr:Gfo/Idh/MocA family oxidoreductase [Planctomycetota bacterium]